ncbi:MAG TPA: hypothetical protein VM182_03450 [Terriglobia bacterium]|nr:hypothetical protein [Terriglobia bacterium]
MKHSRPHSNGCRCTTFAGLGLDEKGLGFRFTEEDLPRNQERHRAIAAIFREYHEIAHLTADEWEATELFYCQGLGSISATARELHVSRKQVRQRIRAGFCKLFDFALKSGILP